VRDELELDRDLKVIQQVRDLVRQASRAQEVLEQMTQEQVDAIVAAMAQAGAQDAKRLAELAVQETEIGRVEDKTLKNLFATKLLHERIRDMKTVGIVSEDREHGVLEIAAPMGVVAAVVPTTNPTSTAMYKAIISIKARNAIVFSPHPRSRQCTLEAVETMRKAAVGAGAPEGCISCLDDPGIAATNELMKNDGVDVIIATGGPGIVKAAYSSGKPAFGVGAGNCPCYIEKSADVLSAAGKIIASKSFDNSTICASEQSILCDAPIRETVVRELEKQGGYFMKAEERLKLEKVLLTPQHAMTAATVGRSAEDLARMAGFSIPPGTRVLIGEIDGVGEGYPLSHEKLSPVLAFYEVKDWREACSLSIRLLELGGLGHTMAMHSRDEKVIMEFALRKPAMRILVNTASSLGGVGGTTGLFPAMTLGCGTSGGNIISDNLGPQHLLNRKRLAYGQREIEDLVRDLLSGTPFGPTAHPVPARTAREEPRRPEPARVPASSDGADEEEMVRRIVNEVFKRLNG
jgi:acetaldehyde dehydrogenase (acetylating)